MMRVARVALVLSLALWVGGLATISFVVAPTAFKVAPSRKDAGKMVGETLRMFGVVERCCAALALGASLALYSKRPAGTQQGKWRTALIILMGGLAAYYTFSVYPDLAVTRMKLEYSPDDPIGKSHFDLLHRISVILVSVNILLGTGLLVCVAALKPSDGA